MTFSVILTNLLAIGALISGVFSITAKNPIISIIFLIGTFVQAAGYLILIGINFIGLSYIIVYVGAIAVLFLFVIMMINIKITEISDTGSQYTKNLPLAIAIGSLFLFIIYTVIPFNFYNEPILYNILNNIITINDYYNNTFILGNGAFADSLYKDFISLTDINNIINTYNISINSDVLFTSFLQIQSLGHNLYIEGAILLIILSFILLLSMFAIIIITKNNNN